MTISNHFERLGLPRRFALDSHELQQAFLALSRELHPDYFATASTAAQQLSLKLSAELNHAYKILKDPYLRAQYLLELLDTTSHQSEETARSSLSAEENREMPAEFLFEMLELREELERLTHQEDESALSQFRAAIQQRLEALLQRVGEQLDSMNPDPPSARKQLNAANYLRGLLRDIKNS